jgi:hypothetical protein
MPLRLYDIPDRAAVLNYLLSEGAKSGLPAPDVVWFDVDSLELTALGQLVPIDEPTLLVSGQGEGTPTDAYNMKATYYNAGYNRYVDMRVGWHGGAGKGFGYRHLVGHGRWSSYGVQLERTMRYGYRFPVNEANSTRVYYYYCEGNYMYTVLVDERQLGDGRSFGVVTGFRKAI